MSSPIKTADDLRAAREVLGLSADAMARMLGFNDGRTVRRYEAGDRELPGSVTVIVETALGYLKKIELLSHQLEELKSGKMRTGINGVDDTQQSILRFEEAKRCYEDAFEILARRPPPGKEAKEVHWYHLRRMTPEFSPSGKDDWSLPSERSPQGALAYFEKHEGFSGGLELCADEDFSADFILEQRLLLQQQIGFAQRLTAGQLVRTFFVRHR
jgi:transcriptional regulator with XRE-family HTH domain